MGFLRPKISTATPPAAPNTPVAADAGTLDSVGGMKGLSSLIATGNSGLRRKANTQKISLVGGA